MKEDKPQAPEERQRIYGRLAELYREAAAAKEQEIEITRQADEEDWDVERFLAARKVFREKLVKVGAESSALMARLKELE